MLKQKRAEELEKKSPGDVVRGRLAYVLVFCSRGYEELVGGGTCVPAGLYLN